MTKIRKHNEEGKWEDIVFIKKVHKHNKDGRIYLPNEFKGRVVILALLPKEEGKFYLKEQEQYEKKMTKVRRAYFKQRELYHQKKAEYEDFSKTMDISLNNHYKKLRQKKQKYDPYHDYDKVDDHQKELKEMRKK